MVKHFKIGDRVKVIFESRKRHRVLYGVIEALIIDDPVTDYSIGGRWYSTADVDDILLCTDEELGKYF